MKQVKVFSIEKELRFRGNLLLSRLVLLPVLFLLLLITGGVSAQPCGMVSSSISGYPPGSIQDVTGTIILPSVRVGSSVDFAIPITVTGYSTGISNLNFSNSDIEATVTVSDNVVTVAVTKRGSTFFENYIDFTLNVTKSGCDTESINFRVFLERLPLKLVLALDISGSMGRIVPGSGVSRLETLKDNVNLFVTTLQEFVQEGDSLGISYFSTTVYQPDAALFPSSLVGLDAGTVGTVASDLASRTPMQLTAMGQGLVDARDKLMGTVSPSRRMVFLVTDGLQNVSPLVCNDGNTLKEPDCATGSVSGFLNTNQPQAIDSIRYFTLATWEAGLAPEILASIAHESGGEALTVIGGTPSLEQWFGEGLVSFLEGGSPQTVYSGNFPNLDGDLAIPFVLNNNLEKLVISVIGNDIDSISLSLSKNDREVQPEKLLKGRNYCLLALPFALLPDSAGNGITPEGSWVLSLSGVSDTPFSVIVLADDHLLRYRCRTDRPIYVVGDTINLQADLSYAGNLPADSAVNVTAIVLRPGDDVGHLLATFSVPLPDSTIDSGSRAAAKYDMLIEQDSAFIRMLQSTEQVVPLSYTANGRFVGSYVSTELTGAYSVLFYVEGELPGCGKLQRVAIKSTVVRFGQVESEVPEVTDSIVYSSEQLKVPVKRVVLHIRPKNVYGYYMGPGYGSTIRVDVKRYSNGFYLLKSRDKLQTSGDVPVVEQIIDNLDGSYDIVLSNVPLKVNPNIEIRVRGESLYQGKLYPVPFWAYLLFALLILLLFLTKYICKQRSKACRWLIRLLLLLLVIIILLHNGGYWIVF